MATKKLRWFSNPSDDAPSVWMRVALVAVLLTVGALGSWLVFGHKKSVDLAIKSVDELQAAMEQRKELDRRIDEFVKVYTGHVQTWESIKNPATCPSIVTASKVAAPTDSPSSKAPVFGPSVSPSGK